MNKYLLRVYTLNVYMAQKPTVLYFKKIERSKI